MITNKRILKIAYLAIIFPLLFGCVSIDNGNEIYVSDINSPLELSSELHDLRIVLYKTDSDGTIFVIKSLDQIVDITYRLEKLVNDLAISADGKYAVFTTIGYLDNVKPVILWKLDIQTGVEIKLTSWDVDYSEIYVSNPIFSMDGNHILFSITRFDTGKTGLGIIDAGGNNLRILNTDIPLTEGPKLSHNGKKILVTCIGEERETHIMRYQLCILNDQGKYLDTITNSGDAHGSYFFSPVDDVVVYNELEKSGIFNILKKRRDFLYITYPNYDNRQLLLDWIVGIHAFSLDGQHILFEGRPDEKSPWGIYIINIDGTNLRHLVYFDDFLEDWYADIEEY